MGEAVAPDFTLPDTGAVLVFYRGDW